MRIPNSFAGILIHKQHRAEEEYSLTKGKTLEKRPQYHAMKNKEQKTGREMLKASSQGQNTVVLTPRR